MSFGCTDRNRTGVTLDDRTLAAIELADTDTLVRSIDGIVGRRAWDELATLRLHLAAALERGRQLWGVDEHARYRMALEAPPEIAIPVVQEGPARFTLGPLTEVVSQSNSFADMGTHLSDPTTTAVVAHERAIRGEQVELGRTDGVFDIPLWETWEPSYALAEYSSDRAVFPTPPPTGGGQLALPDPGRRVEDDATEEALFALVTPWTTMSNGVTDLAIVEGPALAAVSALGVPAAHGRRVEPGSALAWMAWAAASGGAHGRRRGAAAGRFHAWSAVAALAGLDWPADPPALRSAASELEWWLWSDGATVGWSLQLAVHDPADGLSWAFSAADARTDDDKAT